MRRGLQPKRRQKGAPKEHRVKRRPAGTWAERPRPVAPRTAAARRALLATVDSVVDALIVLRRWDDLEAALRHFAAVFESQPRHLLANLLWRALIRDGRATMEPDDYERLSVTAFENVLRPLPFAQAMAALRQTTEQRDAFLAFESIAATLDGGVH